MMGDEGKAVLTVCATCTDTAVPGEAGIGGGARLRDLLQQQLDDHPAADRINVADDGCDL